MSSIIPFDAGGNGVPAHIKAAYSAGLNNDLAGGVSGGYPILSLKGKVWHLVEGGERTLITQPGSDDPQTSIEVVIVKANPHLSKIYYPNGFDDGSGEKPTCYSNDSIKPAPDAQVPQCKTCAACPNNVWGSKITENGNKGKACTDSRRIAVVGVGDYEKPALLRVPAASLKPLAQYSDMLNKKSAPYQAVITKLGFDHSVAHPQLTFKPIGWLPADDFETVMDLSRKDIVEQIVGMSGGGAHADAPDDLDALGAAPAHVAPAQKAAAAPAKPPVKPATAASAPAKKASRFSMSVDDVQVAMTAGKAKPEPEAAPVTKPATPAPSVDHDALMAEANASLDDVLAGLDD
jgi:hypothetical protein